MSVNIKQEAMVSKGLSTAQGSDFELENDMTALVKGREAKPKLLTALLGGEVNNILLETNTVKYDELKETLQLPEGKSFDAYGPDLQKDKPRQLIYEVGSFGLRSNVAPKDYANKRVPGTQDLMDESYITAQMAVKSDAAWGALDELSIAQLLTTDTNITRNGPMPQYNYYTDVIGSSRPAATSMDLLGTTDHFQAFVNEKDLLVEDLEKTFNSANSFVVICGETFFGQRLDIERQEGLARELRSGLDMQSMGVPTSNFGTDTIFQYQWFDSEIDGLRYIRYNASILGTKLIAATSAYMVPVGAETFMKKAFAPAQTRTYVNTTAATRYAWSKEHERNGVTMNQESNFLPMLIHPQLIRHLTV